MQEPPFGLPATWAGALERLARRPALLVALLLALNAVVKPYCGLDHDARLYAAQLVERVAPGTLSSDLYLKYGSQDSYTIFSAVMVPLVRATDLETAFFLAYLLSKALFFAALARLVLKLLPDPVAAVASLLFLAMAPLPFGGNEVIRLNESFLTPRIAGSALTLFALERALSRRFAQAAGLLALGLTIHPLMAFAGGLVLLLWLLFARLPVRWLVALAALAALVGAVAVFYQPLGRRLFGYMDEEWRAVTYQACFFVDPATWAAGDWLRIAASASVAVLAAWFVARRDAPAADRRGGFVAALIVAGLMGVAGNLAAANFHYRLLIQVSPYRTLWLIELLAIPLAFFAAARLWSAGRFGPLAALGVVVAFTADWNAVAFHPFVVILPLLAVVVVWRRGLRRIPAREDWPARAAALTLLLGAAVLLLMNASLVASLLRGRPSFDSDLHPVLMAQRTGQYLFKLPLLALAALAVVHLVRSASRYRIVGPLAVFLVVQGGVAWLDASESYRTRFSIRQRHALGVRDFLARHAADTGRTPTVYWTTDLHDVWFVGRASAYFHSVQLSGCREFNRGTAVEGRRRARLVRHFEAAGLRDCPMPQSWWQQALESLYDVPTAREPTEEDLFALCAEEGLDFVIVTDRFDGLYQATDGLFYFYDCARMRRLACGRPRPGPW